jgi:hypothetical protein
MKMMLVSSAVALLFAIPAQSAEVIISTGHHHRHHHVEKIINDYGQRLHHRHHGQQAFYDSGRRHHHKHPVVINNGY